MMRRRQWFEEMRPVRYQSGRCFVGIPVMCPAGCKAGYEEMPDGTLFECHVCSGRGIVQPWWEEPTKEEA